MLIDINQVPKSIDGQEYHRLSETGIQLMNPYWRAILLFNDKQAKTKRLKRGPK